MNEASTPPTPSTAQLTRHPELRNYQVAALAALVFIFGILFGRGSDLGGALTVTFGVAGVFLRWIAAPLFVLILTTYFLIFPNGIPELGYSDPFSIRRSYFRIEDMILAGALIVYVASQYRLFGVLAQSIPTEGRQSAKLEQVRRPPPAIPEREIAPLFLVVVIAALAAEVVWWVVSAVRFQADGGYSLEIVEAYAYRQPLVAGRFTAPWSRFVLLLAIVFFTATILRVIFSYRRMRSMTPLEARMVLQDIAWNENHREFSRLETWRMWRKRTQRRKG